MPDFADQSESAIEANLASAMSLRKLPPSSPYSGPCQDCGCEIAEPRMLAGYTVCFMCAEFNEFHAKHTRRQGY